MTTDTLQWHFTDTRHIRHYVDRLESLETICGEWMSAVSLVTPWCQSRNVARSLLQHKFVFGCGLAPHPLGSLQRSPGPTAGFKGPASKRGCGRGRKGMEEEEMHGRKWGAIFSKPIFLSSRRLCRLNYPPSINDAFSFFARNSSRRSTERNSIKLCKRLESYEVSQIWKILGVSS